mmetsp:Transcript_2477/g.3436  ORF Transcript_2477/g.3436 Transcript_2477/m.3436 type:complete len:570 (-) Transcript_2477:75-1784(-)
MKVKLSLTATRLPNVAGMFKGTSDPYAIVKISHPGSSPKELGRTEVIKNTLDPRWTRQFVFDHELGTPSFLSVAVFDRIPKETDKPMGSAMIDVDSVLGSKGNLKAKKMKGGGVLYAKVMKHQGMGDFNLQLRGIKLENVEGLFKKSDPFYEVWRREGGGWDTVFRSKPVMESLAPIWPESKMDVALLCGGKLDAPIKIVIYDYERKGDHVLMGEFETSIQGLIAARAFAGAGDINSEDLASAFNVTKKGRETGQVCVLRADISGLEDELSEKMKDASLEDKPAEAEAPAPAPVAYTVDTFVPPPPKPTFVDYISGGCEISMGVAIDYSASNGDPRKAGTPHYFKGEEKNDYESAIQAVGKVLSPYDSDHMHSVWGFGAKYGGVLRNIFQCGPAPEVNGVDGILDAYRATFKSGLAMSEPTDISDVCKAAAAKAAQAQSTSGQAYSILLIITDGKITDVNKAAAAISQVSDSPLSIVIIGVGDADFSGMKYLDDVSAGRDIVQFVPFNKYRHDKNALSAAVLNEVPDQLVEYFQKHGIEPNPPVVQSFDDIALDDVEEETDDIEFTFEP